MADPKPGTIANHPHPHVHHADDCPNSYDRCHVTLYGHIDCPHPHRHMKTEMLTVACGADDPKPQIQQFLNQPGHAHSEVVQVIDLGHNGWLVIFVTPE